MERDATRAAVVLALIDSILESFGGFAAQFSQKGSASEKHGNNVG